MATLSDIDGYFEFDHVEEGEYRVEIGEMDFFRGRMRFKTSDKGPAEIFLVEDTHVEYVTGEVTPPESAVEGS